MQYNIKLINKYLMKRMFEILDEMNIDDVRDNTRLVAVSNTLISVDKVKQGVKISMGADHHFLDDLLSDKVIPVLILVDKSEFFKRRGAVVKND